MLRDEAFGEARRYCFAIWTLIDRDCHFPSRLTKTSAIDTRR
jgi:hypothetical protein